MGNGTRSQFCFQYALHPLSADSKEWKLTTEFLKKFTTLETQFHTLLPSTTVRSQFEDFLMERYDYVKDLNEMDFMQYIINVEKGSPYDDFVCLCQMIAVIPATSVDCERGFSNLGRIKTNLRNRMREHLEPLMRISTTKMDALTLREVHGLNLIKLWRRRKDRRLGGKGDTSLDGHHQ